MLEYASYFVEGHQNIDILLFFLVLGGSKAGPMLLIVKIILAFVLQAAVQKDVLMFLGDSRVISHIVK